MPPAPEPEVFTAAVHAHQAMVFSLAWRIVGNREVAEELAQDVFLSLYQHWGGLESEAHRRHWLRQVTTRRAIDQLRRQRLRPRLGLDDIAEPVAPTTAAADPLLAAQLERWLAALPPRHRAAIVLRYQEDLEPADIARLLGRPVHTVKSWLQRGLAALRRQAQAPASLAPPPEGEHNAAL
ncbi:MAG: RNA polymerase sigma factor [Terriglobales bacterium]